MSYELGGPVQTTFRHKQGDANLTEKINLSEKIIYNYSYIIMHLRKSIGWNIDFLTASVNE